MGKESRILPLLSGENVMVGKEDVTVMRRAKGESDRGGSGPMRRVLMLLAALMIVLPYALSYGDTSGNFTLVNRTRYYLHALIGNTSYVFIAPGRSVVQEVGASSALSVDVAYSPGQGVRGSASQVFDLPVTISHVRSADCSSSRNASDCSSNVDASETVAPARWEVTPADLAAAGEGE